LRIRLPIRARIDCGLKFLIRTKDSYEVLDYTYVSINRSKTLSGSKSKFPINDRILFHVGSGWWDGVIVAKRRQSLANP
jgi:hypothetical protein